jgi:glycerophosphoryl diester phosphodiesterase
MKYYRFLSILMLMNAGCVSQGAEYIAHRGASYLAPENTMSSVLLAWQLDADAVEIDVHLTGDNQIVVIHDQDTQRVSGINLKVSRASLEELQTLDVGRWKDEKYAGEKIPLLNEIIKTIPKDKKLYIEIKCNEEILPYLDKIISKSGKREQITLIGFNLEVITKAKKQMPDIPVYWLVATEKNKLTNNSIPHSPDLLNMARQNKIDGLDVHYAGVDETFMKAVKNSGQDLYVWTVDDPEIASHLIQWKVKGITTNRPKWLKEQLINGKASQ